MSRRNILWLCALFLVFGFFTNKAVAWTGSGTSSDPWDISDKSVSGNNVKAYINGSTLYITGTGNMADFWDSTEGEAPWWFPENNPISNEIKTVNIQSGVTNIGNRAFKDCKNLEKIEIPNTVKIIGRQAFTNCTSLLTITIPNSVTEIEGQAFLDCSNLESVTITNGSQDLNFTGFYYNGNEYAREYKYEWFNGCAKLKTLHLGSKKDIYSGSNPPFYGLSALQNLTIGNTVTEISSYAFANCTNLENVTLQDGPSDLTFAFSGGGNYFDQSPIKTLHLGRNIIYNTNSYINSY